MDPRFTAHNLHLESPDLFNRLDPHLRQVARQPLAYRSPLLDHLPVDRPGLYSLGGGRQIGKTTLLKQWMALLLSRRVPPGRIAYLTGELIDDHHSLVRLLTEWLREVPGDGVVHVVLDEVTYIRDWDRGLKFLADTGALEHAVLVFTGSDFSIMKEARMRLPGRRGRESQVDFHLRPLDLAETVALKGGFSATELETLLRSPEPAGPLVARLQDVLLEYLLHGGYLTAINDLARDGRIAGSTLATYSDWIRGDVLRRGKQEHSLREVLAAVLRRLGTPVTWNHLAADLSIDHPRTVADYVSLLESMDVLLVQPALVEDKLAAAPKKPRKVMFSDPFIYHAVRAWLSPVDDPFTAQVRPGVADPRVASALVEACAVAHVARTRPTFYIKAEGEVDIAYVEGRHFHPVEVKWTSQLRPRDLKQIARYRNGTLWVKGIGHGEISGVPTIPLALALLRFPAFRGEG